VDTRTKIVSVVEASRVAASGAATVSGYFEPLTAAHLDRLEQLKRPGTPLLVLITDPLHPVLPWRARAELVAGLAVVDYVAELADGIAPQVRLEPEHDRQFDELIEHVHARQSAAT
jgi:hypothetical protein